MLVLVPTRREADLLYPNGCPHPLRVIGFGPVEAAVGTLAAIAAEPDAAAEGIVLAGAAGTYDPARAAIGEAIVPGTVRCHGIGVGEGEHHVSAATAGWTESDTIDLGRSGCELLTVPAAAATPAEAEARQRRYPDAVAEEMEGYAVALAAHRSGVGVTLVRGISNRAGLRDGWRLEAALRAVRDRLEELAG